MQLKNRLFSGLGTGAFMYMMVLLSRKNIISSEAEIISVFIISACAGIFTIIFDIEKMNYLFALVIHFIMMFLIVFSISLYNKWVDHFLSIDFLGSFLLLYLFAWIITLTKTKKEANELNDLLKFIKGMHWVTFSLVTQCPIMKWNFKFHHYIRL
ncbi:DUF3021 domain-containing protein [Lysinibacillus xylanilyticus]|uniref:DUF3021 domain-containing protein n=1 Tax=Lysinibacillus xylanilyticus TaxID=582475 RepID=UPI002B24E53E|nr:DUF3021 domain-containing protein [Lysinibacillus xylanilyticus]MEB2281687.1 DUF3021 domain-containing protein [Lysinibacillus xylanilyticus]